MRYKIIFIVLFLLSTQYATPQEGLWNVDFATIFDNREGESKVAESKTFFLTQLAPEIGIGMEGTRHSVMGGVVWTQPIGSEWDGYRLSPTLYYKYVNRGMSGMLGMFPRTLLHSKVPDYIWNDSTYYVQRNIRGAAFVNIGVHGYFQALLDWRGMQNKSQREAFAIIAMGEWIASTACPIGFGGVAMMNHLARRTDAPDNEGVVDNMLYNPYFTIDFASILSALKTFKINTGILGSITRDRKGENKWKTPVGFWFDTQLRWKWLELDQQIYAGGALFPYYEEFGTTLFEGEPYFSSDFYSRTDLKAYILDKSFVKLMAALDFHVTSSDFIFYQRLILNVRFDGSFKKNSKK